MRLKRIVNRTEQTILEDLRETGSSNNFQVEPNQRIADVIEVQKGKISNNEFYFALSSHFDFTICQNYEPKFVVEFDGPHHDSSEQRRKDAIKDKLCEMARLPILRLDGNLIRNRAREYSMVQWFAEIWFLAKEFDEMQSRGEIPADEPFMYQNILGHAEGPMNFPYDIARPVLIYMNQLYREGKSKGYAAKSITYETNNIIKCKSYFKVSDTCVVESRVEFRSFGFYPVSPFELAEDLAVKGLEEKITDYYNHSRGCIPIDRARAEIARVELFCKEKGIYIQTQGIEI